MKSSKTIIIVVVACIVLVLTYFYIVGDEAPAQSGGLFEVGGGSVVGSSVISLLGQIQALKIDTTIFATPAFQSLKPFSVAIPTENVGRDNPFAPIPGVNPNAGTRSNSR